MQDSNKSILKPNILFLRNWGMWKRKSIKENIMFSFFVFGCVFFVPSQYVELWILRKDQNLVLRNLSYTLLSTTCFVKAATLVAWHDDWKKIIECVAALEEGQIFSKDEKDVIEKHKRYSRIVTYSYCSLAACTVFIVTAAPLVFSFLISENRDRILNGIDAYPEIMSSWMPFDKSRKLGFFVTVLLQAAIYVWGGGLVGTYDSTAVTLMLFFAGQLELLKLRCKNLFTEENGSLSYEEINRRIIKCFHHHELILRHCDILNALLSPVMFLYVIICSIMICATAVRITTTESISTVQQLWLAEYLIALISQLFLYCWHSDVVYYSSLSVSYGVFASSWWRQDPRVHRSILLLNGKLQKTILFTAGPFTTLQVRAFIAILKGSYSYYTILK